MHAVVRLAALAGLAVVASTDAATWNYRPQDGADTARIVRAGGSLLTTTPHGLAQSLDQGASWPPLATLDSKGRVFDIAIDPYDAGHWYVDTREPIWNAAAGLAMDSEVRIRETRDSGQTWQTPSAPDGLLAVPQFHPAAPGRLQAYYRDSASGNAYRIVSADGGLSWVVAASAGDVGPYLGLGSGAGHYAGLRSGVDATGRTVSFHLSLDDAQSWGPALVTRQVAWQDALRIRPRRGTGQQVYWIDDAATSAGAIQAGTVDLANGALREFPSISGRVIDLQDAPGTDGATLALVLSQAMPCNFCNNIEVWKLPQAATAWQYRGGIAVGAKFNALETASLLVDGATLWLSGTVGMYRSGDEGLSWTLHKDGLRDAVVNAVSVDPRNGDSLLSGRDLLPLQRSSDGGISWSDVGGQVPQDVRDLLRSPANPDLLFAAALDGLYRSSDAGVTWQRQLTNVDTPAGDRGWRHLAACANGELVARVGESYFRSSGGVATWSEIDRVGYYRLEWARRAPGRLYFVSESGGASYSDDCGATLQALSGSSSYRSIAVDPNDALHFVARTYGIFLPNGLVTSHDGGVSVTFLADPTYYSDAPGWIDACDAERFTDYTLRTLRGANSPLLLETPGMPSMGYARDADSQCISGESVTVLATSNGLWLRRAPADLIFADTAQ